MKHFATFLCVVIVYVCVDLQRVEIGGNELKDDQDARKTASVDTSETIIEDQAVSSHDVYASVQSSECTSNENEACEKPSSEPMNVTSEVKKSEQTTQFRKPVIDLLSLLNLSHRNTSANQHSIGDNRSLARTPTSIRDTGITSRMMISWKYRKERRGALAHQNVANGSVESWDDSVTHGIISQVIKGYVEAPTKVEFRLIRRYVEDCCRSAGSQLEDFAPGYWNEVVRLRNRRATRLETSAVLRKYHEMKSKESETHGRSADRETVDLYEQLESIRNDYKEGEIVERVTTWFECPNKEVVTRLQTWDMTGIVQMFTDFLCMVIGFIGIIFYLIFIRWRMKNDVNEMHRPVKKIAYRVEHI